MSWTSEHPMPRRLAALALALGAVLLLSLAPSVASAAAPAPWWRIIDGSRPSHMWEPADNVQEIKSKKNPTFGAFTAKIVIEGEVVGCLAAGTYVGYTPAEVYTPDELCQKSGLLFEATETAPELEALLEGVFATSAVDVSGGPAGSGTFLVVTHGREVPAINVEVVFGLGTAQTKFVAAGGSGRLVGTFVNLGDAAVDATTTPLTIVDQLPEGVVASGGPQAFAGYTGGVGSETGPVECKVEAPDEVICGFEGRLRPYESIEVQIPVNLLGSPPAAGAPGTLTVSGANAPSASIPQTIDVSSEPVPFGIERFSAVPEEEGGAPATQAGSHPFQFTTVLQLNAGFIASQYGGFGTVDQPALPRNLSFPLPAGLVGNATAMPTCSMTDFLGGTTLGSEAKCSAETVIGASSTTIVEGAFLGLRHVAAPVFNLTPAPGEPARFGLSPLENPVVIDTSVDPGDGYRITAHVRNIVQLAEFLSSTTTFWGTPGDPRHDNSRGKSCIFEKAGCERPASLGETPFLRMPVQCVDPLEFGVAAEPWNVPIGSVLDSVPFLGEQMSGCNRVPFDPRVQSVPTSKLAANPSGLDFQLTMPNSNLFNPKGIAEGQPKKVEVALPEGVSVNPSEGEGLVGCSPAQYAAESAGSAPGAGCPDASKVGTVQIQTPLVAEEAKGSLYVATPHDNPFGALLGLYLVARIPERGIVVKQAGKVEPDPRTGQLVTTFDDLPQMPFSSFRLHFREGGRAPLVTPPTCGTYETLARFTPWSASDPDNPQPNELVLRSASFEVERGVDGGECPSAGTPPFHPGLLAGTINNAAGSYSPFNLRLTRTDGEQEFTHFSIKMPPGVLGKLAGIPFCSDAAIAAAKARTGPNGGQEELEAPSCPAASQIGHTLVGSGVGSVLTYVPGKVYLAGPYHGSALSIAAITAAKVGPFDLGTVVVREALKINPETGEVFIDATGSDPIPHIIQGIPVHARDIRVYVDRPEFVLNPTSCEKTSTASTVLGSGLDFATEADDQPITVTSPFQAADCASLPFAPKLKLSLQGGTRHGAHPALRAFLRARPGEANIAKTVVALPHSEFLENAHIGTVCTRVQFREEDCPAGSVYGHAKAVTPLLEEPLEGPVYLRSSEHKLPDLVAALHSGKIDIDLVGRIDSVKGGGIRTSFESVPDAPVKTFTLAMAGGKKSLLVNSTDLCKGVHRSTILMQGQNGKVRRSRPRLAVRCGGGRHAKGKGRRGSRGG